MAQGSDLIKSRRVFDSVFLPKVTVWYRYNQVYAFLKMNGSFPIYMSAYRQYMSFHITVMVSFRMYTFDYT